MLETSIWAPTSQLPDEMTGTALDSFPLMSLKTCETQRKIEFCNEHPSTHHLDFIINTLFFVLYHMFMSVHSLIRLYCLIFLIHFIGSCRL